MNIKQITPITFGSLRAKYRNDDGTFFYQPIVAMAAVQEEIEGMRLDSIYPVVVWEEDGFDIEDGETGNYVGIEYKTVDKTSNTEKPVEVTFN